MHKFEMLIGKLKNIEYTVYLGYFGIKALSVAQWPSSFYTREDLLNFSSQF